MVNAGRTVTTDFLAPYSRPLTPWSPVDLLTARETEVLVAVARGRSNREIASDLFITATTVKTHVSSMLSKLALRDRVQLVVFAYESGLVRPGR
ncbi:MAG: response regulator containing a CheY-like receiver domain and an DNA-binding domain [Marmoricola sp.]|nr:response regulator containing a CheY-like receiver domain and an DNA-binding domain [Marmoricola sp.]